MLSFTDGTHRSSVRAYCALPAGAARQCPSVEPASAQCHPVRRRAGLQVAGLTAAIRQVAHHLHPDESLGQEWGARPGLCSPATRTTPAHPARGGVAGQHHRQGPSGWHGGVKKTGPQAIGKSRGGWTTKLHLVAANERTALRFSLSPGQAHDAPEGRKLLQRLGGQTATPALVMDRAYEGQDTRHLAVALGFTPVVPPRQNRRAPWAYDRQLYKRRNEVERLFRRLKGFRRIFTRFEKLDVLFLGFIVFALIVEALR